MKIIFTFLFLSLWLFAQEEPFKTYYNNGKIESEINFSGKVRDGAAKFYYDTGSLKMECSYVNGKVDGLVKEYYPNGNLKETYTIQNGKREGPVSLYKEDGTFLSDVFYEEGKRVIDEELMEDESTFTSDELGNDGNPLVTTDVIKKVTDVKVTGDSPPVTMEDSPDSLNDYVTSPERLPEPHGGWVWLYKKLSYPREARENKIEGTTKILAYIDDHGKVVEAKVQEGFNPLCDEAARIAVIYTRFKPGLTKGRDVKTKMIIPVEFKLEKQ